VRLLIVAVVLAPVALIGLSVLGAVRAWTSRAHPTAVRQPDRLTVPSQRRPHVTVPSAAAGTAGFAATWSGSAMTSATCPPGQRLGTCFSVGGTANLAGIGQVEMSRVVFVPPGTTPAPDGCVAVTTDGILIGAAGNLTFHGTGALCQGTSRFTVTGTGGHGPIAARSLSAQILDSGGGEAWSGQIGTAQ